MAGVGTYPGTVPADHANEPFSSLKVIAVPVAVCSNPASVTDQLVPEGRPCSLIVTRYPRLFHGMVVATLAPWTTIVPEAFAVAIQPGNAPTE